MKNIIIMLLGMLIAFPVASQNTFEGKVSDENNNTPLIGATLYFVDLKRGTVTDTSGHFKFEKLPSGIFHLEIRILGYETYFGMIEIKENKLQDFTLNETHLDLKTIIITGISVATEREKLPIASTYLNKEQISENGGTNIVDAISQTPGVNQLSTGAGIGKPIVRGLGLNRVLVLHNNMRQEGQQWGEEHGLELDEFSIESVEIIKGPGSLVYGSDAMGGVINFHSAFPEFDNKNKLEYTGSFQSNNLQQGHSLHYKGNKNYVFWNAQLSHKNAGNYANDYDGKVANSGFKEWNGNGSIGMSKHWGLMQLQFSSFNQKVGIIEGERDSLGNFLQHEIVNDSLIETSLSQENLKKYGINVPMQMVNHHKVNLNGKHFLPKGIIQYNFAFQQNKRREFEYHLHEGEWESEASIFQNLNTFTYDMNYHIHLKEWESTLGLNGYLQNAYNLGEEYIIPEYNLNDRGIYFITQREWNKFLLSGGVRYNYRNVQTDALYLNDEGVTNAADTTAELKFKSFENSFSSFVYSGGLTFTLYNKSYIKLNLASGFRAPNMSELGSNGAHHGTFRYEVGNSNLKPEINRQLDFSFITESKHFSLEISSFYNRINNYIFSRKIFTVDGNDSLIIDEGDANQVFVFSQDDAYLYGGEILIDFHPHPLDWLHLEGGFSFVNSEFVETTDSTKYLPFTPPPRLQLEVRSDKKSIGKCFKNLSVGLKLFYNFKQERIYSAFNTETNTPDYFTLNFSLNTELLNKKGKTIARISFIAQNLTNTTYQSHLSRLKYLDENLASGRQGVFNMGRNYVVKINIPLMISNGK